MLRQAWSLDFCSVSYSVGKAQDHAVWWRRSIEMEDVFQPGIISLHVCRTAGRCAMDVQQGGVCSTFPWEAYNLDNFKAAWHFTAQTFMPHRPGGRNVNNMANMTQSNFLSRILESSKMKRLHCRTSQPQRCLQCRQCSYGDLQPSSASTLV